MSKVWFTSDTHFGHKNIIRYSNRPFDSVEEMDEELIKNWNAVVGENDIVYHIGDVSLTKYDKTLHILSRLNGRKHLITGNHEKSVMSKEYNRQMFESINQLKKIYVEDPDVKGGKQAIVLCHFAMRVWDKSHHGAWHLYGHSHDSLEYEKWGKSMDVGVDAAARVLGEYRPFSYEEVKAIMNKREIKVLDHHTGRNEKKKN